MEKSTLKDWEMIEEKGQPLILAPSLSRLLQSLFLLSGIELTLMALIQWGGFSEEAISLFHLLSAFTLVALFFAGVGVIPYLTGANPNSFLICQGELVCVDSFKKGWKKPFHEFGELRVQSASKENFMQHKLVIEVIEKDSGKVWGRTYIDYLDFEKDFQLQLFVEAIQVEPILLSQFVWTDLDCPLQRGLKEIFIHAAAGLTF